MMPWLLLGHPLLPYSLVYDSPPHDSDPLLPNVSIGAGHPGLVARYIGPVQMCNEAEKWIFHWALFATQPGIVIAGPEIALDLVNYRIALAETAQAGEGFPMSSPQIGLLCL